MFSGKANLETALRRNAFSHVLMGFLDGQRGQAPMPTRLKILRGNPGRRPLNDAEPKPEAGIPKCPSWLSRKEKAEWKDITPDYCGWDCCRRLTGRCWRGILRICEYPAGAS